MAKLDPPYAVVRRYAVQRVTILPLAHRVCLFTYILASSDVVVRAGFVSLRGQKGYSVDHPHWCVFALLLVC
jgi:hypothetical protein